MIKDSSKYSRRFKDSRKKIKDCSKIQVDIQYDSNIQRWFKVGFKYKFNIV